MRPLLPALAPPLRTGALQHRDGRYTGVARKLAAGSGYMNNPTGTTAYHSIFWQWQDRLNTT